MTQNDACLNFHKEKGKNAYSYGQYGGSFSDTYYVYKKDNMGGKPIKTFKFTKENSQTIINEIYKLLDRIGGTNIFEANKTLKSFSDKNRTPYKNPIQSETIEEVITETKNNTPQLTLFTI